MESTPEGFMINVQPGQSSSQPVALPGAMNIYNQTMGLNQENYRNVLQSFQGAGQGLAAALPGIYSQYGDLGKNLLNTLGVGGGGWGVAEPAARSIGQTFEQQNAKTQQQMINAGLGNTSVGANIQNQNAKMAGEAYGSLGAQLSQTAAGYLAQTGLAGIGAQLQGQGMLSDLSSRMGGTLAGYHFSNTAGPLYGSESVSQGYPPNYGGGGGGSGSGGSSGGGGSRGGGGGDVLAGTSAGYSPQFGTWGSSFTPLAKQQGPPPQGRSTDTANAPKTMADLVGSTSGGSSGWTPYDLTGYTDAWGNEI